MTYKALKDAFTVLFRTMSLVSLLAGVYLIVHPAPGTKTWETIVMMLILSFSATVKWEIAEDLRRA